MTFVKQHKHHFGAFTILIAVVIISGYFTFSDRIQDTHNTTQTVDDTIQDTSNKIQTNNKTQNTINKIEITKGKELGSTTTPDVKGDSQQFDTETIEQSTNATLRINGEDYKTKFASSTTVLDLMQEMQFEHKISFSGKEYPGMGMFVEEINGVKNDNLAGKYWIYYVNGQSAQVGISNYIIKPEDKIEWKYENAKF